MTNHPNRNRRVTVDLTPKELRLLNHGLRNGIGDDSIEHLGLTKREQTILAKTANRLRELAGDDQRY